MRFRSIKTRPLFARIPPADQIGYRSGMIAGRVILAMYAGRAMPPDRPGATLVW